MSGEWLIKKRAGQSPVPKPEPQRQPEWVRRANEKKLVQKDYTKS